MFSVTDGYLITDNISTRERVVQQNGDDRTATNGRSLASRDSRTQTSSGPSFRLRRATSRNPDNHEVRSTFPKTARPNFSIETPALLVQKLVETSRYEDKTSNTLTNYFVGNELHGIQQVLKARNRLSQLVWMILIVGICVVAALTTRKVVSKYVQDQTATLYLIKQSQRLEFPSVIVCPKNPDALRMSEVERDVRLRIPQITGSDFRKLVGYAIADAGFANVNRFIQQMNESDHREMTQLLLQWRGERTTHGFYTDLFERFGYRCKDLFAYCQHGAENINCCDVFTSHYVMLRGRCFRLTRLYQTDPDYQGHLYLGLNQLASPLIDRTGLQPQMITYMANPRTEMSTFPRYYNQYMSYNYISVSMRVVSMLESNPQCYSNDETRGRSACYVRKWLHTRLIRPFNCTLFFMHYRSPHLGICELGTVARNYVYVTTVAMNGTKCLPSCFRHDFQYTLYASENKRLQDYAKDIPAFRLEIGYKDLEYEYYEEKTTTSVPGFISEIGGQFGLFAGVTIITVIQLVLNIQMLITRQLKKNL